MRNSRIGIFLIALLMLAAACNSSGCLENRNSVPLAGFYDASTGSAITLDSVQITGLGMSDDDPLSAAGTSISTIYLPMRSTEQSTTWIFSYKWSYLDYPQLCDTLSFDYTSTPYFASNDCGVIYKYLITHFSYTTHLIDSVALSDSLITNVDKEQIQIYFRTATDDDEGDEEVEDESSEDEDDSTDEDEDSEDEEGGDDE